jgi:hypothetical protein
LDRGSRARVLRREQRGPRRQQLRGRPGAGVLLREHVRRRRGVQGQRVRDVWRRGRRLLSGSVLLERLRLPGRRVRPVRRRRATVLRRQRVRERVLRRRHVRSVGLDVRGHRRNVQRRELRQLWRRRSSVLSASAGQRAGRVHRERRHVRRGKRVRELRCGRAALLRRCMHRYGPRLSERQLRAVWRLRPGVLSRQRVRERFVHRRSRLRRVRRLGSDLLRRGLVLVGAGVRAQRDVRCVRRRRSAVLHGDDVLGLHPGVRDGRRGGLRDLRRYGGALLHRQDLRLRPHLPDRPVRLSVARLTSRRGSRRREGARR